MLIRKFNNDDSEILKQIFNICFDNNSPLRLLNPSHRVVAIIDNAIVGGAGLKYGDLHNCVPEAYIAVLPEFRRKGIGVALHNALIEMNPLKQTEIGIDGCCYDNQSVAQSFMKKLGYVKYLDCHCVIVDLCKVNNVPPAYHVENYSNFLARKNSLDSVQKFLISRYIEEHQWSPPRDITHEIWDEIVNEERSKTLSVLITENDQILGVSEARENFLKEGQLAIGWSYAKRSLNELEILKNLLSSQFKLAQSAGFFEAYMEIDSTETTSEEMLNWLPIKETEIFQRYRFS
jgi:GNAT superfamily N-acetyltransferase